MRIGAEARRGIGYTDFLEQFDDALAPLADAGADLQVVMGYRYPNDQRKSAVEVAPVSGKKVSAAAQRAGLDLEVHEGNVLDVLTTAARTAAVVVLGSRDRPGTGEPVGHVARDLMVHLETPVLLVPPDARIIEGPPTLLVPLDGSADA